MSRRFRRGSFWEDRSGLKKILICAAVATILIVIVLVILLTWYLTKSDPLVPTAANIFAPPPTPEICNSPTCLNHSAEIIERIDPSVNPCEDFYQFSCGNLLKKANGNELLGSFFVIQSKSKRQIEDMYEESIRDEEHKVVKVAKKFYRNCLNETGIKIESLRHVKMILEEVGGWAVVAGTQWDGAAFWWIQTCYTLRRFGYFYASFLDISVVTDPIDKDRYIYKISIPALRESHEYFHVRDKFGLMIEAAVAFGAERERAISDMTETYDFLLNLQEQSYLRRNEDTHQRMTVGEFQNQYEFINWLEFINNIVGPGVRIFRDDAVLFPSSGSLYKWFEYISTVSKRTQANYIIWKVVEDLIPHLSISQSEKIHKRHWSYESRPEFCMSQIRKKLSPNPIDVMYVRRYLPPEKKEEVKEILNNLKLELINLLEKIEWSDYTEKQLVVERVAQMKEIIGAPGNYFDDEIFEDVDFDLNEESNYNSFFDLLSSLNKNHESWKYYQIYNTEYDHRVSQWKLQTSSAIGDYFQEENLITIPATLLQNIIFDEKRPKCLNYGSMGTIMGHHFFQIFGESISISSQDGDDINEFGNIFKNASECLNIQLNNSSNSNIHMIDLLLHQNLGLKIAYGAYKNWLKENPNRETKLANIDYNEKQLFWISAASYFCQPLSVHTEEPNIFDHIVSGSMCNNLEFSNDFQCSLGSKMNPLNKCEIF